MKRPDSLEFIAIRITEGTRMKAEEWSKMRQIFIKNMTCAPIGVDELCCWCHVSAVDGQAILLELELTREVRRHTVNRVPRLYQDS